MRSPAKFIAILLGTVALAVSLVSVIRRTADPDAAVTISSTTNSRTAISPELASSLVRLESREQKIAETVWAPEILAQECGRTFEMLWDSINRSTNKMAVLAAFAVGEIVLGKWGAAQQFPHQIEIRQSTGAGPVLTAQEWRGFIQGFERAGWRLAQLEFRHNRFDTNSAVQPHQSTFYFSAHLTNSLAEERAMIEGDLLVDWGDKDATGNLMTVRRIDASRLLVKSRRGEPPFKPILVETIAPPEYSRIIDPFIVYDLDGDGFSEIILAAKNLVYRRSTEGDYKAGDLCRKPEVQMFEALDRG